MMELKIKALSDKVGRDFPAPHYATDGAAAMDLCACLDEPVTLQPGERRVIPSGIAIALPSKDYVALVFARSGLGIKKGIAHFKRRGRDRQRLPRRGRHGAH